jgi:hypothetical protein
MARLGRARAPPGGMKAPGRGGERWVGGTCLQKTGLTPLQIGRTFSARPMPSASSANAGGDWRFVPKNRHFCSHFGESSEV